jgi:drug/metabolite transporter (DMT)-like permease
LKPTTKAHLAGFFANLIFGVNFSIVKYITPSMIKPFGLNVVRVLVTSLLLWTMYVIEPKGEKIRKQDFKLLLLCALTGVTTNQLLFIKGLSMTYSTHASLLILSTPLLITVIAFAVLKESMNWQRIAGLICGISGAMILILSGKKSGTGNQVLLGDIFVILNAISYSFYFILVKPLLHRYTPIQILRWVFTLGGLMILPFGWSEFTHTSWEAFTGLHWAALAFVVLGATFLAYLLNIYGLGHLKASATGTYIYIQPFFAALVAILFLNEPITADKLLSAMLIFAGVYLVNKK